MMLMTWLLRGVSYLSDVMLLRKFLCMLFENYWRRDVYFLNICIIRVFYHFNRSRTLHPPPRKPTLPLKSNSNASNHRIQKSYTPIATTHTKKTPQIKQRLHLPIAEPHPTYSNTHSASTISPDPPRKKHQIRQKNLNQSTHSRSRIKSDQPTRLQSQISKVPLILEPPKKTSWCWQWNHYWWKLYLWH